MYAFSKESFMSARKIVSMTLGIAAPAVRYTASSVTPSGYAIAADCRVGGWIHTLHQRQAMKR